MNSVYQDITDDYIFWAST